MISGKELKDGIIPRSMKQGTLTSTQHKETSTTTIAYMRK
jgi:hypothetical protein